MSGAVRGRGRLSSIDLLPREAESIVAWAVQELAARERTQVDIYGEFVTRCQKLMGEYRGEVDFDIPSFSSFNRFSMRKAALARRLEDTREMAKAMGERFDAAGSDDLTRIAAEAIKSLVFELVTAGGEAGFDPKEAMQLATALKQAAQAQGVSTARRQKLDAEFAAGVEAAVDKVAKVKGITAETAEAIKAQILGVA